MLMTAQAIHGARYRRRRCLAQGGSSYTLDRARPCPLLPAVAWIARISSCMTSDFSATSSMILTASRLSACSATRSRAAESSQYSVAFFVHFDDRLQAGYIRRDRDCNVARLMPVRVVQLKRGRVRFTTARPPPCHDVARAVNALGLDVVGDDPALGRARVLIVAQQEELRAVSVYTQGSLQACPASSNGQRAAAARRSTGPPAPAR